MSPAKDSYAWLPLESVTTGQTHRRHGQTDAGLSDPYVPLCFAGDTIIFLTLKVSNMHPDVMIKSMTYTMTSSLTWCH